MTPEELYLENEALAPYFLNLLYPSCKGDEDMLQEAYIGLWKACKTYDESMDIQFSVYAKACVRTELHNVWRILYRDKRQPDQPVTSLNAKMGEDENDELISMVKGYEIDIFEDFDGFMKILTPRQRQIVTLRIKCGSSYESIGAAFGVSRMTISKEMSKIRAKYDAFMKEDA